MKARALASVVVLALPVAAVACGSNVTVDDVFGPPAGATTTQTGAGGGDTVTPPIGTGGGAPTTTGTGSTGSTTTGSTGTTTTGTTTTGTTTTTWTGGGGGDPGEVCAPFGDPCTGCMSAACPAAWCGCAENVDCLGLFQCVGDCDGDGGCVEQCYAEFQGGIAAAVLVSDCAGQACQADCQWGQPIGDCQTCLVTDCADAYNACIGDADCLALYQCLTGCEPGSLVCQQGCYDDFGDGVEPLQALFDCSKASCSGVCN